MSGCDGVHVSLGRVLVALVCLDEGSCPVIPSLGCYEESGNLVYHVFYDHFEGQFIDFCLEYFSQVLTEIHQLLPLVSEIVEYSKQVHDHFLLV